ncbi:MAG: 2-amino-4-hydroxy-6-hydroxymethyldihydropteridine diphosphokinase [Candidatus Sulfotelmatobacter sp.]
MATLAYLSLGSNIGNREAHLREAVRQLQGVGRATGVSSFYETEPVEFTEQAWFLNCAVGLETALTPQELMSAILGIEKVMGRQRIQKKGPRLIDIDILLFGNVVLNSAEVTIPHPAMTERRFVLEPLAEIAPEVRHPVLNETIRELRDALLEGQIVRKLKSQATDFTD